MTTWLWILTQFSILAFAVLGGVFLAFSDFIMRALGGTSGSGGVEAMQSINREVFRYVFIPLFLAMAPISIILAVSAYMTVNAPASYLSAALIYIVGAFGVTLVRNVPMNNVLAAFDPSAKEGLEYWTNRYLPDWTLWNSIRTVACLLASVVLLFLTP